MIKKDYLLEPATDQTLIRPYGYSSVEWITKQVGWRESKYYMHNGSIYLDKQVQDVNHLIQGELQESKED